MERDVRTSFENHLWGVVSTHRELPDVKLNAHPDFTRYQLGSAECGLISANVVLQETVDKLNLVGKSGINVLIQGETGTGKELIARVIHRACPRKGAPLVVVDCGSITQSLFESEAFGHKKGSFTGAVMDKAGLLEEAHTGVVFLDEVDALDGASQAKLLRFLQERQIRRVGETRYRSVDVQVIAASNRDLQTEVSEGRFRRDLFQRLNQFPVHLPALRNRPEDIELLVRYFIDQFARRFEKTITAVEASVWHALMTYRYEGNVRELQNVIHRAVVFSGDRIDRDSFTGNREAGELWTGVSEGKNAVKRLFQRVLQEKRSAYASISESQKNYSRKYFSQKEIEDIAHALSEFVFRRGFRTPDQADEEFTAHLLQFGHDTVVLNSGFSQSHLARYLEVSNTKRHIEILQLLSVIAQVDGSSTRKLEYFVVFSEDLRLTLSAAVKMKTVQIGADSVQELFYSGSKSRSKEPGDDPVRTTQAGPAQPGIMRFLKLGAATMLFLMVGAASYYFGFGGIGQSERAHTSETVSAGPAILVNAFFADPKGAYGAAEIAFDLRALLESRESVSGAASPYRSGFVMVSRQWQTHDDARKACLETGADLAVWGRVVEDKNHRYLIVRQTFAEENIQTMLGRNLENFNLLVTDQKEFRGATHYLVTNNQPLPVNLSEKSYVISEHYPAAMNQMANDVFELYNLALGISELERGKLVEAESFFEKAYNTIRKVHGPRDSKVFNGSGINQRSLICFYRGSVRLMMRDYPTAAAYFKESTGLDSLFSDGYCSEGIARFKSGQVETAIGLFKKAIDLEKRAEFYNNLGVIYIAKYQSIAGEAWNEATPKPDQRSGAASFASYVKTKDASEPVMLPRNLALAFDAFRKAVTLRPAMMEAKLNLRNLSGALVFLRGSQELLDKKVDEAMLPVDRNELVEILAHIEDDPSSPLLDQGELLLRKSVLGDSPRKIMISDN